MLKIQNLTKYYGDILGVDDISLSIKDGEIFGFIGPNGAGKSTTIKCILNFLNKDSGIILVDDEEVTDKTKEIIGYLPSEISLYDDLTVGEIFDYHEVFFDKKIHKRRKELVKKLKINALQYYILGVQM